jgi:hypothetical protein
MGFAQSKEPKQIALLGMLSNKGAFSLLPLQHFLSHHLVERFAHSALTYAELFCQLHFTGQQLRGLPITLYQTSCEQIIDLFIQWLKTFA